MDTARANVRPVQGVQRPPLPIAQRVDLAAEYDAIVVHEVNALSLSSRCRREMQTAAMCLQGPRW